MADGFVWAGKRPPTIRSLYIPTATAIEKGEPVNFKQGTGVIVLAEPNDFDDPITGVATAAHAANSGTSLEVVMNDSDDCIFKYKCCKTYTLTGGSTTTAVDSSLVPATNSFWKGGAIQIVSCAADSSLNGRIVKISDSAGSSGTLTLAETLPAALASGDTIYICPGYMAYEHLGYDLDSDAMNPDFEADGGNVLRILYTNPDTMEMFVRFERHANVS